jgi:hypothetical protein
MLLRNKTSNVLDIGDIALPLAMNTDYIGGDLMDEAAVRLTYQNRLNIHRFISGHGSFIFWMRANGVGPYLLMVPTEHTKLEYFDRDYIAYIHSAYSGKKETNGTWRQEHTNRLLAPQGKTGDTAFYEFKFVWGDGYDGVRNALYQNGSFDIHVIPGMVVPVDLSARFSLKTRNHIHSVSAEYPHQTQIEYLGEAEKEVLIYAVKFSKLGENRITVNYNENSKMILEFFVTEPLETVYKKRAEFIVGNQQHRNEKWYNGLFSLWDMKEKVLRGPDNLGGLQPYMVGGSDDPSNSKCIYLAEKNVAYPDTGEIRALEYFLENFVWGKHQRTDKEYPHPYGIYGSDNWYLNRTTEWGIADTQLIKNLEKQWVVPTGTGLGKERMWRTFDYTTYIMLYYDMYLIARSYPHTVKYLDALGYLERAFGTAKAFFQVPYSIYMVGKPLWAHQGFADWAYKLGNFHEKYIVELIAALIYEGWTDKANWLRNEWEKKVKYFIKDDPSPFGSEFVFDRTAFESTHAIARYAIENPLDPDTNLWFDKNKKKWYSHSRMTPEEAYDFLKRQIDANLAMRGWLETTYYYLGSAQVGDWALDYMSQMAGWSILDYALYFSQDPATYTRLGYASILSSWALVNSGTAESNFGYWFPGKENDGAAGWNFEVKKHGTSWGFGELIRGPWHVDGEIDHGLAGGLKAAATVVIDDPIFSRFVYGGEFKTEKGMIQVIPRDGIRRRFHFITDKQKFHLQLLSDGFVKDRPLIFNDSLSEISFEIENRSRVDHTFCFCCSGLPAGTYAIAINGKKISMLKSEDGNEIRWEFPNFTENSMQVKIKRQSK